MYVIVIETRDHELTVQIYHPRIIAYEAADPAIVPCVDDFVLEGRNRLYLWIGLVNRPNGAVKKHEISFLPVGSPRTYQNGDGYEYREKWRCSHGTSCQIGTNWHSFLQPHRQNRKYQKPW